jgi:hypothetical protein
LARIFSESLVEIWGEGWCLTSVTGSVDCCWPIGADWGRRLANPPPAQPSEDPRQMK